MQAAALVALLWARLWKPPQQGQWLEGLVSYWQQRQYCKRLAVARLAVARKAAAVVPAERLWVNPDCGLKTREWSQVIPSLENMVKAATEARAQLA